MPQTYEKTAESIQNAAVASWVERLNKIRFDALIERLQQQDLNLKDAMKEIADLVSFIGDPSHILGSQNTKHGEIAEHFQVNLKNAANAVKGLEKEYTFNGVGRTAPEDYLYNGQPVQSKFYNGLKNTLFGKHALADHLETYPHFVKNGGFYDIPKDQYEKLITIMDKFNNSPSKLGKSDYALAKRVNDFLKEKNLVLSKDIRPACVTQKEVQLGNVNQTVTTAAQESRHQ